MVKIKKLIHKGWEEWNTIQEAIKNKLSFGKEGWAGKYQYIFSSDKGEVSLVKLKVNGFSKPFWTWEIMELSSNNLFEDVERFRTKKQAIKRIKEILK